MHTIEKGLLTAAFTAAAVIGTIVAPYPMALITIPPALLSIVVFFNSSFKMDPRDCPIRESKLLTPMEKALTHSIFGDEIDTSEVTKNFSDVFSLAAADVGDEKNINFYGFLTHSEDYALTNNTVKYHLFLHEMTHIWQHQRHKNSHGENRGYKYTLSPQSSFEDFGTEQQADIIGDYAGFFLHPSHFPVRDAGNVELLQKIVENRFPKAREARLAFNACEKTTKSSAKPGCFLTCNGSHALAS